MLTLKKAIQSSVGQKFIMALSGLALVGFIIVHLLGNLTLFAPDSTPFNAYVQKLYSMGPLLLVAEGGLVFLFVLHMVTAIRITIKNKAARPEKYAVQQSKKGPSKSNLASRNMIISGLILLVFLVIHIADFRLGPGVNEGYVTTINGQQTRDLHRLVVEEFKEPGEVVFYVAVMLFLGMHLRHGFWSAFQSLGALNPRLEKPIYAAGLGLALLLAAGFLLIPLWLYFK